MAICDICKRELYPVKAQEVFDNAVENNLDIWVRACGGSEEPFLMNGRKYLYVYNPKLREHKYLDMSVDTLLTNDEWFNLIGIKG